MGAVPRWMRIVGLLAAIAAAVLLARQTVFMFQPSRTAASFAPSSRWEIEHSCLTAYYVAAEAASSGANVYDDALYSAPGVDPAKPRKPLKLGSFNIDVYEYPPPFLLLPKAMLLLTPQFLSLRVLWFVLNLGALVAGLVLVARELGLGARERALVLSPLVLAAIPTVSALQKGNVQILVVAVSMIAMVLFARGRVVSGGALLAFATVSKLFPGVLVLYLLLRRRWREAGWTLGWGALLSIAALAIFGLPSYLAFLDHLPRLLSGEAFPAFRMSPPKAINFSIPGLVFKLGLFGVPGMGFPAAKAVGWIYSIALLAATIVAARRSWGRREPLVWLALVLLATLRSPFLPQAYAALPPLWLLTLFAATRAPSRSGPLLLLGGFAALNVYWPHDWPIDPRWLALANTLLPQAVTVAVAVAALRPLEDRAIRERGEDARVVVGPEEAPVRGT